MSKQSTADIKCEHCGYEFEKQVYTSVNVKQNPELRQRVLNGEFFKHECHSCGNIIKSFHQVLYHDSERKFMVLLVQPDKENIIFMQRNSLKMTEILQNYILSVSRYPFQWIERIITLEFKMDPRIIELYKFWEKERQQLPLKTENDFIHFQKYSRNFIGRKIFHWNMIYNNGETESYSKLVDSRKYQAYENLVISLESKLKLTSWYLIDWQFPFGLEIRDNELIQLPVTSDFIEFGEKKTKLPSQFLDIISKRNMGRKL